MHPSQEKRRAHSQEDRPDLVVIGPDIGVVVLEVKDWKLRRNTFEWLDQYTVRKTNELGQVAARFRVDLARGNAFDQGLQYNFSRIGGALGLLTPIWFGPVMIEAGGELGYGWSWQDITGGGSRSGGDLFAGPTATATTRLGPVRLGLDGSFGAQLFKLNGEATIKPQGSLGLVLLFGVGR